MFGEYSSNIISFIDTIVARKLELGTFHASGVTDENKDGGVDESSWAIYILLVCNNTH
jgi:hypothetical protein